MQYTFSILGSEGSLSSWGLFRSQNVCIIMESDSMYYHDIEIFITVHSVLAFHLYMDPWISTYLILQLKPCTYFDLLMQTIYLTRHFEGR